MAVMTAERRVQWSTAPVSSRDMNGRDRRWRFAGSGEVGHRPRLSGSGRQTATHQTREQLSLRAGGGEGNADPGGGLGDAILIRCSREVVNSAVARGCGLGMAS